MARLKLLREAIILPIDEKWSPRALGRNTVVKNVAGDRLTEMPHPYGAHGELPVFYRDIADRVARGWLDKSTPVTEVGKKWELVTVPPSNEDKSISLRDRVREGVALGKKGAASWFWSALKKDSTILFAFLRESGVKVAKTIANEELVRRSMAVLLNREIEMQEVTEQETTERRSRKGKKNRKQRGDREVKRRVARENGGSHATGGIATIAELLPKSALAKRLANGDELSKKQLTQLQGEVNEAADRAREAGKDSRASKLSNINRAVRRLRRQA